MYRMILLFFAVSNLTVSQSEAQPQPDSVVADTLDWHRYYPLAIGDVWEYRVMEGEPLRVHRIIGDSLASERHYYLMEIMTWNFGHPDGGTWRDTLFVRYGESGGVYRLTSPEADTMATPQTMQFLNGSRGYYDLRTAFGDSVFYSTGPEDYYVTSGGYQESIRLGNPAIVVAAVKHFTGGVMWETYAADIGLMSSTNLFGPIITYAKVSGIEYGVSRIPTAIEEKSPVPLRFTIESIYPNPTTGRATVNYRLPEPQSITVEIFNVLGQRVWSDAISLKPTGVHSYSFDTAKWKAGTYFVRIATRGGQQSVRPVILIR